MPATRSLTDCERLATAVQEVGGRIPKTLASILSGAALLASHSATSDPARSIVDSALAGELDGKRLDKLVTEAATAQMINAYRGELGQRSERLLVDAFHKALQNGAADELLDSLRPQFDKAAEAIAAAMVMIPPSGSAEAFLTTAKPAAVEAWQGLSEHLAHIEAIARIAAQFGPRTGPFPMITEYALGDNYKLDDRAIMATDGGLVTDSALFRGPGVHRASPWARTMLRLHSIESAQARYNDWAASEWDRQHGGPQESWIDEHGKMHERPRPENPFKVQAST